MLLISSRVSETDLSRFSQLLTSLSNCLYSSPFFFFFCEDEQEQQRFAAELVSTFPETHRTISVDAFMRLTSEAAIETQTEFQPIAEICFPEPEDATSTDEGALVREAIAASAFQERAQLERLTALAATLQADLSVDGYTYLYHVYDVLFTTPAQFSAFSSYLLPQLKLQTIASIFFLKMPAGQAPQLAEFLTSVRSAPGFADRPVFGCFLDHAACAFRMSLLVEDSEITTNWKQVLEMHEAPKGTRPTAATDVSTAQDGNTTSVADFPLRENAVRLLSGFHKLCHTVILYGWVFACLSPAMFFFFLFFIISNSVLQSIFYWSLSTQERALLDRYLQSPEASD